MGKNGRPSESWSLVKIEMKSEISLHVDRVETVLFFEDGFQLKSELSFRRVGRSVCRPKTFSWNLNPKKRFIQTFLKALGPYGRRIWCKMYVIGSSTDEWQSYGAESTNQKSGFWFLQMLKQKTQSEFERKTIVTGMDSFSWNYFPHLPVSLCRWPWPMRNSQGSFFEPIRIYFKPKKKYWTRILTQPLLKLKKSKLKRMIINKMWFRWGYLKASREKHYVT